MCALHISGNFFKIHILEHHLKPRILIYRPLLEAEESDTLQCSDPMLLEEITRDALSPLRIENAF